LSRSNFNKREERNRLITRLFCLFLALLMVLGVAYYAIFFLASSFFVKADSLNDAGTFDTSILKEESDYKVSVGLNYGSNLTTGFQVTTEEGFTLGIQWMDGDREYDPLWDLYTTKISCTADLNLSKSNMTYSVATSNRNTVIGGYHVQVDCDHLTRSEFENLIAERGNMIWGMGLSLIPSYIYNGYAIRVGHFESWSVAESYVSAVAEVFPEHYVSVVSPNDTSVSVVDPTTDDILFEFDGFDRFELGISAHENRVGNTYMKTPAGNVYDGVFVFKRAINNDLEGVALINIIPLETYVGGVIPFETSNAWPIEAQKALSIIVRSFTLTNTTKHNNLGFDICNTVCCQVYKGAGAINTRLMNALLDTVGEVMTYNNKIVQAYYSSSVGGVTVSSIDAWGSGTEIPYLQAIETPWENYMEYPYGFWKTEISPKDLLERMHKAGYTNLRGEIADVDIVEFAKNSTYIKKLRVTDSYGTSVTITNTDNVRTSLTPYVYSANFVIGKGSVEYTEGVSIDNNQNPGNNSGSGDLDNGNSSGGTGSADFEKTTLTRFTVISSDRTQRVTATANKVIRILTGDGVASQRNKNVYVATSSNSGAYASSVSVLTGDDTVSALSSSGTETRTLTSRASSSQAIYKTAYAENPNNFIIVGKGWGHGVGTSQWGIYDLANLGYSMEDILSTYFNGTRIIDYRKLN